MRIALRIYQHNEYNMMYVYTSITFRQWIIFLFDTNHNETRRRSMSVYTDVSHHWHWYGHFTDVNSVYY